MVAFVRYFDLNHDHRIDLAEFTSGLQRMDYAGDIAELFQEIDKDDSGFITLTEIDHLSADLWASFKAWCAQTFATAEEMEAKLGCAFSKDSTGELRNIATNATGLGQRKPLPGGRGAVILSKGFNKSQFVEHSVRNGWYGGNEQILFATLDLERCGFVTADQLTWWDKERERQLKRLAAAAKGVKAHRGTLYTMRSKIQSTRMLQAFRSFLKRKYGCLFRAWRLVLDRDGIMVVSRKKFFQAFRELGWSGDINGLWHALDADESGSSSLEELACSAARALGLFKRWSQAKFGGSKATMRALNTIHGSKTSKAGTLNKEQWKIACQTAGFEGDAGRLFDLLDWERNGRITVQELSCLDKWSSPAEYLLADPNYRAAQRFRDALQKKYKHFVKAWCNGVDQSGVGKVTWLDFKRSAEKCHFKDDVAGAWVALDEDGSGSITLKEIDPEAAGSLANFRCWAHDEFGSVYLAFEALDKDGSGTLRLREFIRGLQSHGFKGDPVTLFHSLDFDDSAELSAAEVAFLDEWLLVEILDDHEDSDAGVVVEDEEDIGDGVQEADKSIRPSSEKRRRRKGQWPRIASHTVPFPQSGRLDLLVRPRRCTATALLARDPRKMLHEEVAAPPDEQWASSADRLRGPLTRQGLAPAEICCTSLAGAPRGGSWTWARS